MKRYGLVIAFVLMLAASLALRFTYNPRPERVVGDALKKLRDARSFMGATTVATFAPERVVAAAGADPNLVLLPVVFVGEAGVNIPPDGKLSGTAKFELIGNAEEGKNVAFSVVTAEGGTSYVKFENIPQEKTSAKVVEELNDKWYSMRSRGLAALLAKDGDATSDQEDETGKPAAEAWARIRESVTSGELFGQPVAQGKQVLGAVSTAKYDLPMKRDVLVRVAQDIKTIVRGRSLTDAERQEVAKGLVDRDVSLQIWVDRRTRQIVQANLDVTSRGIEETDKKPTTSLLSVLIRFTSWNEPVPVEVPADSSPFVDLIERLKKK